MAGRCHGMAQRWASVGYVNRETRVTESHRSPLRSDARLGAAALASRRIRSYGLDNLSYTQRGRP